MKTLHCITVLYNPVKWNSRVNLMVTFLDNMIRQQAALPPDFSLEVHVVECLHKDQVSSLPHRLRRLVNHIVVRSDDIVWNKESLINIGIKQLPEDWKYVAWVDGDVIFRNQSWVQDTLAALQDHAVVQPWSYCVDLGPNDEPMLTHKSFALQHSTHAKPKQNYSDWHPGYAWAATRKVMDTTGGLYAHALLGSADQHMAWAFLGRLKERLGASWPVPYVQHVLAWQKAAKQFGPVYPVKGTLEHMFHGTKKDRGYGWRWNLLSRHSVNPLVDLTFNKDGVLSYSGNKPKLQEDIKAYFYSRKEDSK